LNNYVAYIEKTLNVNANVSAYGKANNLPLYLRNGYDFIVLAILSTQCLLARPKEPANLTALRKQCGQLKKLTGLDCVLCLESARIYTKEKLLSEGIPFIIAGQQIFMPFLGVALSQSGIRDIPSKDQISFCTQKLILTAIYEDWKQTTLTEAATTLGVSKMSVTRCFDELQSLGLHVIKKEGKMRRFAWDGSRMALWESARPFLRRPVAQEYRLAERIEISCAKLGGMSAVCHYSMLADNPYTTYAITKETADGIELAKTRLLPEGEQPFMVLQILKYDLEFRDPTAIDPLTAILSLKDDEAADARVEAAVDEILGDCLRG